MFAFKHQQLAQKYSLINNFPEMRIIKDQEKDITEQSINMPRVKIRDFSRVIKRKEFVSFSDPPNEKRFDQTDDVINNKFVSTMKRT